MKQPFAALPAVKELQGQVDKFQSASLRELFFSDPERFSKFSLQYKDLLLDYSKNKIDDMAHSLLMRLALEADVPGMIEKMFSAVRINTSEHKPALHTAFRDRTCKSIVLDGEDISPQTRATLDKMADIAMRVRTAEMRGFTGDAFTDVLTIGLGAWGESTKLAVEALAPYSESAMRFHFVTSFDPTCIKTSLRGLVAHTTLVIIVGNSAADPMLAPIVGIARGWLSDEIRSTSCFGTHLITVLQDVASAGALGVAEANVLKLPPWVSERYSLWSAASLPLAIAIGAENFEQFLEGAHEMDVHFRNAGFPNNMAVILGMLDVWYISFLGANAVGVVPFADLLRSLPGHLRSVDQSANAKVVTRDGVPMSAQVCVPVIGAVGYLHSHSRG
jgi:glucose-6-phosphate isomerase